MRQYLIDLAIHFKGNYFQIEKALLNELIVPHHRCFENVVTILDKGYPQILLDLENPPFVLFYRGNLSLLYQESVAVIGSRNPSQYAVKMTKQLVGKISETLVIVSGLAYGIDSVAHYNALNTGTVAVLGCGVDVYYPLQNRELQDLIAKKHCVISEYPKGCRPQKFHFPIRNRIIAGLSRTIYVMSAELKSGTMSTVEQGLNLNRDIVCLPHNIDEPASEGCNLLISEGARVLTNI